jgi:hypothetical protein
MQKRAFMRRNSNNSKGVPVQIQTNSNSETSEELVRKPKRCRSDKRSEAQRLAKEIVNIYVEGQNVVG